MGLFLKPGKLHYRKLRSYKYQVRTAEQLNVGIYPKRAIETTFLNLATDGWLIIRPGYAWDGASGPAINTKTFRRGSLVHDALYQLMKEGLLSWEHKAQADELLRQICLVDRMWKVRADWVHWAVDRYGYRWAMKGKQPKDLYAP